MLQVCTKTQSTRAHCSSCEHQAYTSRYIHIYTRNPPICAKNDVAHNAHNGNDFLFVRTFAPLSWSFWPHMRACTKNRVSRIGWFVPLVFFRKKKKHIPLYADAHRTRPCSLNSFTSIFCAAHHHQSAMHSARFVARKCYRESTA